MRSFFLLSLLPMPLFAAETAAASSNGIGTGSYVQALLALLLIVAVLLGTAWLARKVSGGRMFGQGGMKVIGGIALGPRERLVLVEVGETWLVIGIVPGQIRTLHHLPKGAPLPEDLAAAPTPSFSTWLQSVSERRNNNA